MTNLHYRLTVASFTKLSGQDFLVAKGRVGLSRHQTLNFSGYQNNFSPRSVSQVFCANRAKRQRAAAVPDASRGTRRRKQRPASWSAPALWSFPTRIRMRHGAADTKSSWTAPAKRERRRRFRAHEAVWKIQKRFVRAKVVSRCACHRSPRPARIGGSFHELCARVLT